MSTPLPATRFIVDSLLPEGLHLLAGSPKTGKSWLALWMCLCVSKGEPVWELPTMQGTVLYLCLEDSYPGEHPTGWERKKKERRFSLPQISLPRPDWAWLLFPAALVGLAVLWYSSVTILRALGI